MKGKKMKALQLAFLALVAVFMVRYFRRNITQIRDLDFQINWKVFALSMLFYFAYKITLASLWHYITLLNHSAIAYGQALCAYLYSILGKYIPGKVFMLAARFPAYEREGVPLRRVTINFLIENVCTVLAAAFLFLLSLFFFPNDLLSAYRGAAALLVVLFFVCLHPKILNFFLGLVEKVTKKKDMQIDLTYPQMLKVEGLFILNWLIVGVGFYVLTCSMNPLPASQILYVGGIWGVSAVAGILALFAPSGIGVREGIMVLGLSLLMPSQMAVIISIVSRLWQSVAELILIFAAYVISRFKGARPCP